MSVSNDIFAAAAARQLEIVRPDHEETKEDSGLQCYWRKPDGTITFGSCTANGLKSYTKKKFTMLPDYGEFTTAYDGARRWDVMTDPYRRILERGGIKEFTREQIAELGWHRKPHAILALAIRALVGSGMSEAEATLAVMPQLADFNRVDVPCNLCPGRVFNSEGELQRHEVLHREDVLMRRQTDALVSAVSGSQIASTETLAPVLRMLAEAIQSLAVGQAEQRTAIANVQALIAKSEAPVPAAKSTK